MLHYDSFCFSSDFDDTMFEGGDTGVIHKGCRVPSAGQRGSMALAAGRTKTPLSKWQESLAVEQLLLSIGHVNSCLAPLGETPCNCFEELESRLEAMYDEIKAVFKCHGMHVMACHNAAELHSKARRAEAAAARDEVSLFLGSGLHGVSLSLHGAKSMCAAKTAMFNNNVSVASRFSGSTMLWMHPIPPARLQRPHKENIQRNLFCQQFDNSSGVAMAVSRHYWHVLTIDAVPHAAQLWMGVCVLSRAGRAW